MEKRFARQGFLGIEGQRTIERARVAICGLGGGGSHLITQLAHVGVLDFVLFDADRAEEWNLNRTVTLIESDIKDRTLKIDAAERRIKQICSAAHVEKHPCRWQKRVEVLRGCDIAFGSVDGFKEREELEATCRRYLLPLIDIGLDLHPVDGAPPDMSGQVILSMPGDACMKCLGFLTKENLALEAQKYGEACDNPQVVWALGNLASTAVGVFVDLVTDWTRSLRERVHLIYRGNTGIIKADNRLLYVTHQCPHYPLDQVGEPRFRAV
jgi:molybdopterin-synthase adenylyltransferase